MSKKVLEFRIVDHGAHHPDYFQGHGLSYTSFIDTGLGYGMNPFEALEDALDSLALNGWNVEPILFSPDYEKLHDSEESVNGDEDRYWYVSVDVR